MPKIQSTFLETSTLRVQKEHTIRLMRDDVHYSLLSSCRFSPNFLVHQSVFLVQMISLLPCFIPFAN